MLGPGPGLELGNHVLDVPVAVRQPVHELQVEAAPRLLQNVTKHDLQIIFAQYYKTAVVRLGVTVQNPSLPEYLR